MLCVWGRERERAFFVFIPLERRGKTLLDVLLLWRRGGSFALCDPSHRERGGDTTFLPPFPRELSSTEAVRPSELSSRGSRRPSVFVQTADSLLHSLLEQGGEPRPLLGIFKEKVGEFSPSLSVQEGEEIWPVAFLFYPRRRRERYSRHPLLEE